MAIPIKILCALLLQKLIKKVRRPIDQLLKQLPSLNFILIQIFGMVIKKKWNWNPTYLQRGN